jgi:hypothetical protein
MRAARSTRNLGRHRFRGVWGASSYWLTMTFVCQPPGLV